MQTFLVEGTNSKGDLLFTAHVQAVSTDDAFDKAFEACIEQFGVADFGEDMHLRITPVTADDVGFYEMYPEEAEVRDYLHSINA